jgi:hypothetical protein
MFWYPGVSHRALVEVVGTKQHSRQRLIALRNSERLMGARDLSANVDRLFRSDHTGLSAYLWWPTQIIGTAE